MQDTDLHPVSPQITTMDMNYQAAIGQENYLVIILNREITSRNLGFVRFYAFYAQCLTYLSYHFFTISYAYYLSHTILYVSCYRCRRGSLDRAWLSLHIYLKRPRPHVWGSPLGT